MQANNKPDDGRAESKKKGTNTAKDWVRNATTDEIIAIAACDFRYKETLNDLIKDGYEVPPSSDRNFSWGFFKQVKGYAFNAVNAYRRGRTQQQQPLPPRINH